MAERVTQRRCRSKEHANENTKESEYLSRRRYEQWRRHSCLVRWWVVSRQCTPRSQSWFFAELSEHESDDSLSQMHNNNNNSNNNNPVFSDVISRSTHPPSNELIPFDSPYAEPSGFLGGPSRTSSYPSSSSLIPTNSFSSSSSSMTVNDDHASSSELDFCTLVSTGIATSGVGHGSNIEFAHHHHHWLDHQSLTGQQ